MSHQVNYFLTPSDMNATFDRIAKVAPVVILKSESPTASPLVVSHHEFINERKWLFYHLARPEDMSIIITEHIPTQGYWLVDEHKSPVIKLGRCYVDDKLIRRNRMYYTDGDYDANGQWVEKSEDFKTWAKAVFRAAKKGLTCLKDAHAGWYIGPEAQQWIETKGIQLDQG